MTDHKREKSFRTRLLIYPRFQLVLICANLITVLLAFLGVWSQVNQTFSDLRNMGAESGLAQSHAYFKFISLQEHVLLNCLRVALAFALIVSAGFMMLISHRIAGPLVRLRGYFSSIAEGILPQRALSFRKGDFFADLPPIVNGAISVLQEQRHSEKPAQRAADG